MWIVWTQKFGLEPVLFSKKEVAVQHATQLKGWLAYASADVYVSQVDSDDVVNTLATKTEAVEVA